uniref:DEAD/DEAH box helicase n=1 Tax=candidate division WOR-3 bacterium TaxID=2052148 RepID=A0A7V3KNH1_UNCW3
MSIFDLRQAVIDEYGKYVQSFFSIADERIRSFIEESLLQNQALWPDALIQLNPSYQMGVSIQDLVDEGRLDPLCAQIFRDKGKPIQLFRHQQEAIEKALEGKHFIITSGTGSGKTLTYFIPIFNAILRSNPEEVKTRAIIVYPMNALVNSQEEALKRLFVQYKSFTGKDCPIRFSKYTGQEKEQEKYIIQKNPPHILLTNYVMLELMLIRPEEHNLVDKTTANLQFLVIDELHTYRGRQGADVGLLIRRLRERSGNKNLQCIGTSATMIAGKSTSRKERQLAVAQFASKIFGVFFDHNNVIEESLKRVASSETIPSLDNLKKSLQSSPPQTAEEFINNPLTAWIENTFGLEEEAEGILRRKAPLSLTEGAKRLSEMTGFDLSLCQKRLKEMVLLGSQLRTEDGNSLFALKLHQFVNQGRTVYATIEPRSKRFLTLEGQYFAPQGKEEYILYPLQFCRLCGQDYYMVAMDTEYNRFLPIDLQSNQHDVTDLVKGYFMISSEEEGIDWSSDHLPSEWYNNDGKVKRDYREHVPLAIWAFPDGRIKNEPDPKFLKGWFQPTPFMLCLNCGEFYTRRDRFDFRKISGLSSEGRSTSTTILSISALLHAPKGGIKEDTRKILSFTDNRQDASLQAGHFNDFVQVSILRAAILNALKKYGQLRFDNAAQRVLESLGLSLSQIAKNKELQENTPQGQEVWNTFRDLVEYRLFEDLRRGWRIVQPNLEQCGLLCIEYTGLKELCQDEKNWMDLPPFLDLSPQKRQEVITALLDHFRKKLAISAECLKEQYQQQLRKRVLERINERWSFEEKEVLNTAKRFLLPGQSNSSIEGFSLGESSLIGRYLRRTLSIPKSYSNFIQKLIDLLSSHGLLKKGSERGVPFVQLDGTCLLWEPCLTGLPPFDPIYTRRVASEGYLEIERKANEYFRDFYKRWAEALRDIEGREHTAQITYENRQEREERFRNGDLACLFCSPTMELGIDIADLQLVHLRNVPPTPANYAQRSGRAGRRGDPALIITYCGAGSGHDQYFFRHRQEMVSGVVRPPRIDLGSEDLVRAHIHALWLSKVRLSFGDSITDILDINFSNYPLKENIRAQIRLTEERIKECREEAERILDTCRSDLDGAGWYSRDWLESVLKRVPDEFDNSFERWRELYKSADRQWQEANEILRHPVRDKNQRSIAENRRREAERQKALLCNFGIIREESDFYPYRYLASEGFLPGYNFPSLPIRAYIPRGDGEFISRPRFLALTEFGPRNIIYHEGAKYEVRKLFIPPGGLSSKRMQGKICKVCGYFQKKANADLCENCNTRLDATTSEVLSLLELFNVQTWRRERITSDEEERRRLGYEVTTQFRFAPLPGGKKRVFEATIHDEKNSPIIHIIYAPTAELYRINHGWLNKKEKGFLIDMENGDWLKGADVEEEEYGQVPSSGHSEIVRLYVRDYHNLLLLYPLEAQLRRDENLQATLQYCLQRGIEQVFQIEETELTSERIGSGSNRAILFWEATEGGVGVLRRLIEEQDALSKVALAALERCHFNPETIEDLKSDCSRACYECLLSYTNQRDYPRLNRHAIKEILVRLSRAIVLAYKDGKSYEDHYHLLRSLTDSRSDLERKFIDYLYQSKRRLPDEGQKYLKDYYSNPDFFYEPNVCIFCDGSVHDEPLQREKDRITRQELKDLGYRVIVIRYDQDLEEQIRRYPDVFG